MKRLVLGAGLGILVLGGIAIAQTVAPAPGGGLVMTGQRLSELCKAQTEADRGVCLGYINGVAELLLIYKVICYNHITRGDLNDTVLKYMAAHPEEIPRHTAAV